MRGCGILDGDRLFVRPVRDVRQAIDEIVVCRVAEGLHVRRLSIAGERIELVSENHRYDPILVDESEFALLGVVVGRAGEL